MNKEPLVYIILVNYNSTDHTLECIKSLKQIDYSNYRIIVVDNASNSDERKKLNELMDDIIIIYSNINGGFSFGNNLGIKQAIKNEAKYILMLNNDTVVKEDFLNKMIDEYDDKIGICTSKIYYYDNKEILWYAGGEINKTMGNSIVYGLNEVDNGNYNENKFVTFASGCCMLFSVDIIKKIGYLKEDYFLYYEDTDYCSRIIENGYKIKYCPKSVIYHKESVSTVKKSYNYDYYFTRNRLFFIKENLSGVYKATSYFYTLSTGIIKALINKTNRKAYLKGIRDFICNKKGKLKL